MATKINMLKLLQEMRGFSEMARPQPASKRSALYLMQLRAHVSAVSRPRQRLVVQIDPRDFSALPDPVTIIHLRPAKRPRALIV